MAGWRRAEGLDVVGGARLGGGLTACCWMGFDGRAALPTWRHAPGGFPGVGAKGGAAATPSPGCHSNSVKYRCTRSTN